MLYTIAKGGVQLADERGSDGYDSLCEKIQKLIEEVSVLRRDAGADTVWDRITRELDCHTMKLDQTTENPEKEKKHWDTEFLR